MNFEGLKNYEFFISLGYVTIIASILTMIVTQIIKLILKKTKKIYPDMNATEKDVILSRVGRIVALVIYASLYIGNEFYLKHTITFDGALLTGLLSGSTFTLTIAKGLYTMIKETSKAISLIFILLQGQVVAKYVYDAYGNHMWKINKTTRRTFYVCE